MRRARITYPGAFHHVMNRGYEGKNIFQAEKGSGYFLSHPKAGFTWNKKISTWTAMD